MGCCGVAYTLHIGAGKKDLRDPIDEHAKMHELGIAHGHGGSKEAYEMSGKLAHSHDDEVNLKTPLRYPGGKSKAIKIK